MLPVKTEFHIYGNPPCTMAVVHGGPGAAGDLAPVARMLSAFGGIIEPYQSAPTVDGQVRELLGILEQNCTVPSIIIGHSWGAWLGYILAARYPRALKKLILIASGPFEEKYAGSIMETRLSRLSADDRSEYHRLVESLNSREPKGKDKVFEKLGKLTSKADAYDPLENDEAIVNYDADIHRTVWKEAGEMRRSGELLGLGRHIRCPVVAIHGEYDPHPAAGVEEPLTRVLRDFRCIVLPRCGHKPWMEKQARTGFYTLLQSEIQKGIEA